MMVRSQGLHDSSISSIVANSTRLSSPLSHVDSHSHSETRRAEKKKKKSAHFLPPIKDSEESHSTKKTIAKLERTWNGSCIMNRSTLMASSISSSFSLSGWTGSIHGDEYCFCPSVRTCLTSSSRKLWTKIPILMGRRSAKIATRKTAQDARKSKIYGRIGKQIISAVKQGGSSSPVSNSILAGVLQTAKELGVPKDVIERNIKRASEKDQQDFMQLTYEVYGFGSIGIVVEALTDNVNRSASTIRDVVKKCGGKIADPGSVLFNFRRAGLIYVRADKVEPDALLAAAMDAGAEDVLEPTTSVIEDDLDATEKYYKVSTYVDQYVDVKNKLQNVGIPVDSDNSGIELIPTTTFEPDDEAMELNRIMMEKLLELDDVDGVYSNQV